MTESLYLFASYLIAFALAVAMIGLVPESLFLTAWLALPVCLLILPTTN